MLVFQRMNEADGVYEGNGALRLLGIPYASCRNVAVPAAFGFGYVLKMLVHGSDIRIIFMIPEGDQCNLAFLILGFDVSDNLVHAPVKLFGIG